MTGSAAKRDQLIQAREYSMCCTQLVSCSAVANFAVIESVACIVVYVGTIKGTHADAHASHAHVVAMALAEWVAASSASSGLLLLLADVRRAWHAN
jgi:hypothetical protein